MTGVTVAFAANAHICREILFINQKHYLECQALKTTQICSSKVTNKVLKMDIEPTPDRLLCKLCSNLLKNAVNLPCCQALVCRGCAVKSILRNKSKCVLAFCLKPSQISGIKGNEKVRKQCELYAKQQTIQHLAYK